MATEKLYKKCSDCKVCYLSDEPNFTKPTKPARRNVVVSFEEACTIGSFVRNVDFEALSKLDLQWSEATLCFKIRVSYCNAYVCHVLKSKCKLEDCDKPGFRDLLIDELMDMCMLNYYRMPHIIKMYTEYTK